MAPSELFIYAPDLPASRHWYADVLGCQLLYCSGETVRFEMAEGHTLFLSSVGQEAEFMLPVHHVAGYAQRFQQRLLVSGDNQGRVVETSPNNLALVDPAGNLLHLIESA